MAVNDTPSISPDRGFAPLMACAANATLAVSKFRSAAGWLDSKSTATSVPMGKYGSDPVQAILLMSFGPASLPRASIDSPSCALVSMTGPAVFWAHVDQSR